MKMNDELVLRTSKKDIKGMIVIQALPVGIFLILWFSSGELRMLYFLAIWLFLIMLLIAKSRRISEGDIGVTVNPQGITSHRWEWGFLPWEDVEVLWAERAHAKYLRYDIINFRVKNPNEYTPRMKLLNRVMWTPNSWLGYGHFGLNTMGLDGTVADIWNHILRLESSGKISVNIRNKKYKF